MRMMVKSVTLGCGVIGVLWYWGVVGCGLNEALRVGIADGGRNAAAEMMNRFPEISPLLKEAIVEAVVAGVDRAIEKLKLEPQSNGWLSSIVSSAALILCYIVSRRFSWARAVIDFMKGLPEKSSEKVVDELDKVNGERENESTPNRVL